MTELRQAVQEARNLASNELLTKAAYLRLVFRLKHFGLDKQADAFRLLVKRPDLRDRVAEDILKEHGTDTLDESAS